MTQRTPKTRRDKPRTDGPLWLYGRHAVAAALANPARHQHQLLATKNALDWLADRGQVIPVDPVQPSALDTALPKGAVHQGLAMKANPLAEPNLEDVCTGEDDRPVLVLDQVTDPQNIGTLIRTAAAFGARAVIVQDRKTPPLSGALAKAAVGMLEHVPVLRVVNIARTLSQLQETGYEVLGLAGEGAVTLSDVRTSRPVALVSGAEGAGLRSLVRETCDQLVSIPMDPQVESLNVASATAVAFYGLQLTKQNAE